jgi:hypothetical protein
MLALKVMYVRALFRAKLYMKKKETLYLQEDWTNEMRMDVVDKLTNTRIYV